MSTLSAGLLGAIVAGLVLGYFLHRMTCQRDVLVKVLAHSDKALRDDARRIRVLRDEVDTSNRLLTQAAAAIREQLDTITLLRAENARLTIERDGSRHALSVQIAGPGERLALLGSNVVALRKAGRR